MTRHLSTVVHEFADTGFAPAMIARLEEARLVAVEDRIETERMLGGMAS